MRHLLPTFACLLIVFNLYGQSKSIDIKGSITDTLGEPLPLSTVLLLDPVDTTLISYTRADENGHFILKKQKRTAALLKISYVGFMPQIINVNPASEGDLDIGNVKLEEIAKDLFKLW